MHDWIDDLIELCARGEAAVLVTVAGIRGSAPRETGAKMIVTSRDTIGTIGGGQLEYQCTRLAVGMLSREGASLRRFPLATAMGQCCGGVVDILFEPIANGIPAWLRDLAALYREHIPAVIVTGVPESAPLKLVVTADAVAGIDAQHAPAAAVAEARTILAGDRTARRTTDEIYEPVAVSDMNIAVFGAGHVGTAVVDVLSKLDCCIRWVDSRRGIFPGVATNVRTIEASVPSLEVLAMPPASYYLVMTHSHALDFDICDRVLRRADSRYCGLIGSVSKRRRFEKRFRQQGMAQAMFDALVCPIGVAGISGKKPAEIAIAVAAELLELRDRRVATTMPGYPDNVRRLERKDNY